MKIENFETKNYEELLAFSKKIWPQKSEAYLNYRLFQIPENIDDNKCNLIVRNDDGKIIGCTLYFPTKAKIKGKEVKIIWSHDMFVEEQYRGAAGLLLIIEINKNKSTFGFGMTDINFKINKELGTRFIGAANLYVIFNIWSYKLLLMKLKFIQISGLHKYSFPDKLKVGTHIFSKISNVNELKIPDKGYWSNSSVDIEFVRDEHFLKKRFFENFTKYNFYRLDHNNPNQNDECYFVVRPSIESGFLILSVVDFRFNFKKIEQYKLIIRAASMLCRKNRLPIVSIRTSVEYRRFNLYPLFYKTKSKQHIVTTYPIEDNLKLFVTNADSDSDFLAEGHSF